MQNDKDIAQACALHGAKAVSDAACRRMNGDRGALPNVAWKAARHSHGQTE